MLTIIARCPTKTDLRSTFLEPVIECLRQNHFNRTQSVFMLAHNILITRALRHICIASKRSRCKRFKRCTRKASMRGRRLKRKGKGVLGARETRGARGDRGGEGNACQETTVVLVFNIHQVNVKILIGPSSKHVNHSVNTLIRLAEINITLLSNLIDLSVII